MEEEYKEMKRAMEVFTKIAQLENPNETNTAWNDVYMLAHSFDETCGKNHPEWRKHLEELEKNLANV